MRAPLFACHVLLPSAVSIKPHCGHLHPDRRLIFAHLHRQRLCQTQLLPRDHVDAHRIAQVRDFQFQLRIQCRRAVLLSPQRLQLKAQVNAPEVLKNVEQEKHRYDSAQPRRLVKILLPGRLRVAHQTRIINPLHRSEFPHRHCLLFLHVYTLAAAKRPALFPRNAISRSSTAGSPALPLHWAALHVSSRFSASLAWPLREMLLSRSDLPGSDTSKRRTAPLASLWRASRSITSRSRPTPCSPLFSPSETPLSLNA